MIYYLKGSVDLRWLFDLVLHSPLDDHVKKTKTNYLIGSRDEERETKERRRLLKEKMDRIRFSPVCASLILGLFDFGKTISDTSKALWFQRSSSSSFSWTSISTNVKSYNYQRFKFHLRDRNRARNAIEIWKEFVEVSSLHPKNKDWKSSLTLTLNDCICRIEDRGNTLALRKRWRTTSGTGRAR